MEQTTTTLKTHGIKCQGCATAARAAVEMVPGVKGAEFDLPGKTATVIHDQATSRNAVAEALTKAGFPAE